jgi:hypothetical protein
MISREQFEKYVAQDLERLLGPARPHITEFMRWDIHTGYWRQFQEAGITVEGVTERTYQKLARAASLDPEGRT